MSEVLDAIEANPSGTPIDVVAKSGKKLDIIQIPELLIDNTDRNRTSPFAFTGNRFEFRAVGSTANCASAMIALNSAVADQLKEFKIAVDKAMVSGKSRDVAIVDTLKEYIKECRAIRFDGNGYSDEWKVEAEKRGLDCETSVPLIIDRYLSDSTIGMFTRTGVMTEVELNARNEVKWEQYAKMIQIESRVLEDMSKNHIIPVATRYQTSILENVTMMKDIFPETYKELSSADMEIIEKIAFHSAQIKKGVREMVNARKDANKLTHERDKAIAYHDKVAPYLDSIRYHIDKLELMVDNQIWPLPKYRELLFIR